MGTRLKILHFVYDHPANPWCGGGGAQRSWAINRLLARQHDITVCCGAFPEQKLPPEPFRLKSLGDARHYKESRLKYIWRSLFVNTRPYDLIVEDFSPFSPALFRARHKPVITVAHYFLGKEAMAFRRFWGWGAFVNEQIILRRRKNIILVSPHLKDALPPGTRVAAIPPGVDLPGNITTAETPYALYVGRLDIKIKGLDVLINAWSKVPASKRWLPLRIIGDGDREGVEQLIQQTGVRDVQLMGRCSHEEAMRHMARAAFVCIPSRMEGCGLVLYEALALGKPVIASAIPAFRKLAAPLDAAMLVRAGDTKALHASLETMMADSELRLRLADRAERVGRQFTWERAAYEQDAFYRQVLAGR